jgi:hypothetical protein
LYRIGDVGSRQQEQAFTAGDGGEAEKTITVK